MQRIFTLFFCLLTLFTSALAKADEEFRISDTIPLTGRVIFTGTKDKDSKLYVLDLDDRRVSQIDVGAGSNSYGSLSPDGSKIAFVSNRDGDSDIYISDFDGGNVKALYDSPLHEDNPTWSPDGTKVLYYSGKSSESGDTTLFSTAINGGAPIQLTTFNGRNTTPAWSPNGDFLAYSTNRFWPGWDVCIFSLNKKEEDCPLSGARTYCRPKWSNRGNELLYSEGVLKNIDLFVFEIKTKAKTQLTDLPNREYDGTWYKDDNFVFFVNDGDKEDQFNLFLTDTKDHRSSPLVLSNEISIRYPSYASARTMELEAARFRSMDSSKK